MYRPYLAGNDGATTSTSRHKHLRLYLHFYGTKFDRIGDQQSTDLNSQITTTLQPLGNLINTYAFISTFTIPLATKLGWMLNQYNR